MARFYKATITGVTSPVWISAKLAAKFVKYTDPSDDKIKFAGTTANPCIAEKSASGEVRTEVDCSSLFGTTTTNVTVSFTDSAGGAALEKVFPVVTWSSWKGESGAEDTKPGRFSLGFEAQVPT